MSFFKKYRNKKEFNNNLKIAQIRNEPVYEGVMSIIYSNFRNDINLLVMERNNVVYPWPNMKMFGVIGERETGDVISNSLNIIKKNISPSVNDETFQKIIKSIKVHKKLEFHLNPNFLNVEMNVVLVEIDDYILRSCRGFNNNEIKNMYYIRLEELYNLISKTRLYTPEIINTVQPHFGHMFWTERIHMDLIKKYYKNKVIADVLF